MPRIKSYYNCNGIPGEVLTPSVEIDVTPIDPSRGDLRVLKLDLAHSAYVLKNQELRAARFLQATFQNLVRYCREIEACQQRCRELELSDPQIQPERGQAMRIQFAEAPWPTSTRPSPTTTSRWRPAAMPRERSCSTGKSSSSMVPCPTAYSRLIAAIPLWSQAEPERPRLPYLGSGSIAHTPACTSLAALTQYCKPLPIVAASMAQTIAV